MTAKNFFLALLILLISLPILVLIILKSFIPSNINLPGSVIELKTETFRSYLSSIKAAEGGELLVAEITDTIELSEKIENKEYWTGITLGNSTVSVRAPVMYKYYININDEWLVRTDDNFVVVLAPDIKLSKPPSVITSGIQKFVHDKWLSFDGSKTADRLVQQLTMKATDAGDRPARIAMARTYARKAIAAFVKKWIVNENINSKIIIIQFPNERTDDIREGF